jgi:hypothetical protein
LIASSAQRGDSREFAEVARLGHALGVGDLLETPLAELYAGGGLRYLSYTLTGDPFRADPRCWHAAPEA